MWRTGSRSVLVGTDQGHSTQALLCGLPWAYAWMVTQEGCIALGVPARCSTHT